MRNVAEELVNSPYAQLLDKVRKEFHERVFTNKPTIKDARRGNFMSPKEFGQLKRR